MKTVNEVSKQTGVSVRTLHYYDEIGLLKPSQVTEAGYRLYDDATVERLRKILFFREFGIPLKDIRQLLQASEMDQSQLLQEQKSILLRRKKKLERLLGQMDRLLRGEKEMAYETFTREDIEELFHTFMEHAPEHILEESIREYGSLEAFRENYVTKCFQLYNQPETREILLESYGDVQGVLNVANHPVGQQGVEEYQKKTDEIQRQLVNCKREGMKCDALEVMVLIGAYAAAAKKMFALKEERYLLLQMADTYQNYEQIAKGLDEQYQESGFAEFLAEGIRHFYR